MHGTALVLIYIFKSTDCLSETNKILSEFLSVYQCQCIKNVKFFSTASIVPLQIWLPNSEVETSCPLCFGHRFYYVCVFTGHISTSTVYSTQFKPSSMIATILHSASRKISRHFLPDINTPLTLYSPIE